MSRKALRFESSYPQGHRPKYDICLTIFMLLLLISVDGLVAPGISSSSNISVYKQHVDWNHRSIDTNCRIQNCSCNNSGDWLHKYVGHHYGEDMMESNLSIGWADELKKCKFNISVHSFRDAIWLCRCKEKTVREFQVTLRFAAVQISSTTFCNLFLISS